ncbi:MAG: TetR/AcrR family transcriptional regulator [Flavobacteriales bacterium]|nr:TetR/AcrR family transcriptional regulator [Flavobacteriales bacterium]
MARYHLEPESSLSLRDTNSPLGQQIVQEGLGLMNELGLEAFNFRKLAERVGCTEATIYHYFKNKQRLLQYYFQLYWLWLDTHIDVTLRSNTGAREHMHGTIRALAGLWPEDALAAQVPPAALRELVINEGSKSFQHKNVDSDNAKQLFKPYKDLCARVADELRSCAPQVNHASSFATTLVEMAHSLEFAMHHLPALTELSVHKDREELARFLIALTERYLQDTGRTSKNTLSSGTGPSPKGGRDRRPSAQ